MEQDWGDKDGRKLTWVCVSMTEAEMRMVYVCLH